MSVTAYALGFILSAAIVILIPTSGGLLVSILTFIVLSLIFKRVLERWL